MNLEHSGAMAEIPVGVTYQGSGLEDLGGSLSG